MDTSVPVVITFGGLLNREIINMIQLLVFCNSICNAIVNNHVDLSQLKLLSYIVMFFLV